MFNEKSEVFLDMKNSFVPKVGISYNFSNDTDWNAGANAHSHYDIEPETEKSPHLEESKMAYLTALKNCLERCLKDFECQVNYYFLFVKNIEYISFILKIKCQKVLKCHKCESL